MGREMMRRTSVFLFVVGVLGALGMGPAAPVPPTEPQVPEPYVCFWSDQGPVCDARAAMDGGDPEAPPDPEAGLEALLAGPTAAERARGLRTAIPTGTALVALDLRPDGQAVVRLDVPARALWGLSHATFEAIVEQVGGTLMPSGWRDLRLQVRHPERDAFVPLSDFLPPVAPPRKPAPAPDEGDPVALDALAPPGGQPPAPGQGQPGGALSGKAVYISAGHGWQWTGNAWRAQRPPYPYPPYEHPIIEDHNNAEVIDQYLLPYLWNAGAMVWPARERDMNGAQVIVDNDAPGTNGYAEQGDWMPSGSGSEGYAGTNYHYAATVTGTQATATAVWTAPLPADGRYAVYVWYRPGPNRAPDARYTVHHAGGATPVTVDQRAHGDTWHYVGTYDFRAAEDARVTLDNRSAVADQAVIADAVRFGGGTFDDLAGIETTAPYPPSKPWWEVATFYYAQRMGMDQPPGDVTARPLYARWEHAGSGDDAVYVSWHTNGATGYQTWASGTETYAHNGETLPRTAGSLELRDALQHEVVQDLRAGWDPAWVDRGEKVRNLGELRLLWDADERARMPGALIEIAFHDHPEDTDALRDPRFNRVAARAIYQGIVKYFEQRDGIDLTLLPEPPTHLTARNVGAGRVRLAWRPPPTDTVDLVGDAATGYRVYTSTTGLGWSNGRVAAGTAYTLTGLSEGQTVFVKVTATNAGGESFPTAVLGVRVGDPAGVLLVNGFDRLNRFAMIPEVDPVEGYNVRMFLDRMNRYDYVVSHGSVISAAFDSASNEAVAKGWIPLGDYAVVDWILGEESAEDETLSAAERAALAAYLDGGGALLISGSELGWDLVGQGRDPDFYQTYLHAGYVGDDAGTYAASPTGGGVFAGLGSLYFDAAEEYDVDSPDRLSARAGAQVALTYLGGSGDGAAIQYADGCQRVLYLGFPFETLWPVQRGPVMARVMDFLDECLAGPVDTVIDAPAYGGAYRTVPAFTGTAEAGDGWVRRVEVQVERAGDGQYWSENGWGATAVWLATTGGATWAYDLLPVLTADGTYHLRARAWAADGRADPSPAQVSFTYDTHAPAATSLLAPLDPITATAVHLAWEPVPPDGGSPLAYQVDLDGWFYTTTQTLYTVTHVAEGDHTWGVQTLDAAGNRAAWAEGAFSVHQRHTRLPLVMREYTPPTNVCVDALVNGEFESDDAWAFSNQATYNTDPTFVRSGLRSARVGIPPGEPGGGGTVYSSVRQAVTLPVGGSAILRLWLYPISEGNDPDDLHYVTLRDGAGQLHWLDSGTGDGRTWEGRVYDLSDYAGQTVTLYVGARNDGDDDTAALYVDDGTLEVCP